MIYRARQIGPKMRDLIVLAEGRETGHFRQIRLLGSWHRAAFWICHERPDISVLLRARKAACVDPLAFQFRIFGERRDQAAFAGVSFNPPAMIGALDRFAVKLPE